ncbi:molybdate ABC transporter substrate-binding protein [Aliikangiella marina]|uniref:Molybdate ABC transporter substrate-binding protein n=1 Tax=Aliikangiella marina TaxID=1712262 RepID=A0A545T7G8_9GAMM|nr:molybdate ABC transporter substrate-binding protein [Aliikangiella marina]TQV73173.1 molybdate ABC transporter substrate-binding protein [Aliikangiella marina]
MGICGIGRAAELGALWNWEKLSIPISQYTLNHGTHHFNDSRFGDRTDNRADIKASILGNDSGSNISMFSSVRLIVMVLLFASFSVSAERLNVAVASNFLQPMKQIVAEYELSSAHKVNLITGSSGKLFAQIVNGAPFDLFFSADQDKVERLLKIGLADPKHRYTYAIGRLVVWSRNSAVHPDSHYLSKGKYNKLAMANPQLAPYGVAAREFLEELQLYDRLSTRIVMGENINQTFQFVFTQNAQIGLVALAQVISLEENLQGAYWVVPSDLHQPIAQDAVVLNGSNKRAAANDFLNFVKSTTGKHIIRSFGYELSEVIAHVN